MFPTKRKLPSSSSSSIFSYSSLSLSLSPSFPLPLSVPPLLWDHGNCASSVAFHALPAALQEEACSNDLLLSSLAIIALTINSRLAFLCGGGGGGGGGGGVRVWAPSLELLVMCLAAVPILPLVPFHCRYHVCFIDASLYASLPHRVTDTECKSAPGRCFYPSGLRETHEYTFHMRDMEGNILRRLFQVHPASAGVFSQQTQFMEMSNALSYHNAFRSR